MSKWIDLVSLTPLPSYKVVYEQPAPLPFAVAASVVSTRFREPLLRLYETTIETTESGYREPIPELSRTQKKAESLVCPYCTQALALSSFQDPNKWR
jgi:predicted methyltransferase